MPRTRNVNRAALGDRAVTISQKVSLQERARAAALYPPVNVPRPETRGECIDGPRPCPFVGCKHHLYLDINPQSGTIKLNYPDLEPWELEDSCALDVAERGGLTLEDVGILTNCTRERVRQVETRGLLRLMAPARALRGT